MYSSIPNKYLYSLALFFSPWVFFGITYKGIAIYLSFFFIVLDIFFWLNLLRYALLQKKYDKLLLVYILLLPLMVMAALSPGVFSLKLIGIVLYTVYMYYGIKIYGIKPLKISFILIFLLVIAQSFESNLFKTDYFYVKNWLHVVNQNLTIGIGSILGYSYAQGPLPFFPVMRVSGSAIEPGYLSAILFATIPLFIKDKRMLLLITFMFFMCLSKDTLFQFICLLAFFGFLKRINFGFTIIVMVSCYFMLAYLVQHLAGGWQNLRSENLSLYVRFLGAELFSHFPWYYKLIGVGQDHECAYAPYYLTANLTNVDRGCSAASFSNIGSFVCAYGILGLTLMILLFNYIIYKDSSDFSGIHMRKLCFYVFICASFSVSYLTFYPIFYVLLAYALTHGNTVFIEKSEHNSTSLKFYNATLNDKII